MRVEGVRHDAVAKDTIYNSFSHEFCINLKLTSKAKIPEKLLYDEFVNT